MPERNEEPFVVTGPGTRQADDIKAIVNKHTSVRLGNLKIEGKLKFDYEQPVTLFECEDVEFANEFEASGPKGNFMFSNTTFRGGSNFYLCEIQNLEFDHCSFHGEATFHSVHTPKLWLNGSSFQSDAIFVAIQTADLNLADAHFEKAVDFSGAVIGEFNAPRLRSREPIIISWAQFGSNQLARSLQWATAPDKQEERLSRLKQVETELLFWKRNFSALGAQRDARIANYEIIRLRQAYFMSPWQIEWWATVLLGLPNGYGTSPYRPLWIALIIICGFALFYWWTDPFVVESEVQKYSKKPLLPFALFYSIDTFLPIISVTGVKAWGWKISQKYRWVELLERLLGLAVGTLAAYSLGSYLI